MHTVYLRTALALRILVLNLSNGKLATAGITGSRELGETTLSSRQITGNMVILTPLVTELLPVMVKFMSAVLGLTLAGAPHMIQLHGMVVMLGPWLLTMTAMILMMTTKIVLNGRLVRPGLLEIAVPDGAAHMSASHGLILVGVPLMILVVNMARMLGLSQVECLSAEIGSMG